MCELVGREDLWYYLFSFNWGKIYFSSEPNIKTINHSRLEWRKNIFLFSRYKPKIFSLIHIHRYYAVE